MDCPTFRVPWICRAQTGRRRTRPGVLSSFAIAFVLSASRSPSLSPRRWRRLYWLRSSSWWPPRILRQWPASRRPAAPPRPRAGGAAAVGDEAPGNVAFVWRKGDANAGIERASHVVRLASQVSRVAALPLEPRGALGRVDETGRLVLHASNQSPHILKMALANLLQVPAAQIRVVAKDVGGSFGMKSGAYPEDVLVLYAARKLGRPVRWISQRQESFLA